MKRSSSRASVAGLAAPLWALAQRAYFPFLALTAIALMMAGQTEQGALAVDRARARLTDAVTPLLNAFSRPAATVAGAVESVRHVVDVHDENTRLRAENDRLRLWQQAALRLEAENRSLRDLLAYKPDPSANFITARVVADPGGAFVRTLVVTAGRQDGVRRGQAAMAGQGLIGRVVQVGEWSSRILLVTDLNARIPVVLETSRQRAMLGGDNTNRPRLLYVPRGTALVPGERVFTSGHGGLFPPGLPVGLVEVRPEGDSRIVPLVDLARVEHVQLVDFGLPGGLAAEASLPGAME